MSDLPRTTVEVQDLDDREYFVVPVEGMEPIWADCGACGGEGGFWTAGTEGEGPLPSASRVMCPKCVDGRVLVSLIATRPCDNCNGSGTLVSCGACGTYPTVGHPACTHTVFQVPCPSCGGRGSIPTAEAEDRCKVHDGFPMPNGRSCSVAAFGPWNDECEWVRVVVIPWRDS